MKKVEFYKTKDKQPEDDQKVIIRYPYAMDTCYICCEAVYLGKSYYDDPDTGECRHVGYTFKDEEGYYEDYNEWTEYFEGWKEVILDKD